MKKLSVILVILILALTFFTVGCQKETAQPTPAPETTETPDEDTGTTETPGEDTEEPVESQNDTGTEEVTLEEAPEVGKLAPDFKLKNMNDEEIELSSFRGKKPVFMVFWASG